ncbi:hypothetical protein CDAR_84491 [Caerostris darwini]|uniref:Uncharacterized protein n=1 Tax=Caerostris darwini TaxID=1538125 RepID=A0AAV4T291_9ARAC|nr:hypothetical protein CDAR_84491 [Caerostris darwini]
MNESFGYRYNPNYTPEPRFISGYGGYLPGKLSRYGSTYACVSHEVLRRRPSVANRLAPLVPEGIERDDRGKKVTLECHCQTGKGFILHFTVLCINK